MKARIMYTSMTGNTEEIAFLVADALRTQGLEVEVLDINDTRIDLFLDSDLCIIATYTYGDGEIPYDFLLGYDRLKTLDLEGKVFGCIGSGDRDYDQFCTAVDAFEAAFITTKARRGSPSVKIHLSPDNQDKQRIVAFAEACVAVLNETHL